MADPATTAAPTTEQGEGAARSAERGSTGGRPDEPRPGTTDPRRSRVRALKVLFQADLRGQDPSATVAGIALDPAALALLDDPDGEEDLLPDVAAELDAYARTLVDGVAARRHRLDGIIGRFSRRWEVQRMPVVDRNILRMGVWELLFQQVSPAVVIDEAIELAKDLSGDASHRFVNGILESVRKEADTLRADLAQPDPDPTDLAEPDEPDEPVADPVAVHEAADTDPQPGDPVVEDDPGPEDDPVVGDDSVDDVDPVAGDATQQSLLTADRDDAPDERVG